LATNSGWDWGTFARYVTAKSVMAAVWLTIPLIVQLLLWFDIAYLYQTLAIGIPFGPAFFTFNVNSVSSGSMAAIIGLALHQAAYSAEIVRAGIISVDQGQLEAAAALGIPSVHHGDRRTVLPSAGDLRAQWPGGADARA
jgi:polar amino acid transport system permease protein